MEVTQTEDNGGPQAGIGIAAGDTEKQRTKNSRRQAAEHTGAMASHADARATHLNELDRNRASVGDDRRVYLLTIDYSPECRRASIRHSVSIHPAAPRRKKTSPYLVSHHRAP
jgi:hypothetical protein